jgi:hypothetical protein
MGNLNLSIRIEELSPFARWLFALLKQYQQQFSDYSPDFAETFTAILQRKIDTVDNLVSSELFIGELSKATQRLTDKMIAARPPLLLLEGYVKRAAPNLDVLAKDFNFPAVRKCINGSDAEGFRKKLGSLLQLVDANTTILQAKGLKPELRQKLGTILSESAVLAQEQNDKMLAKEKAVKENTELLNELWNDCLNIMDAGKRIFKYTDPDMVKNFTRTYILQTMRHETAHNPPETPVKE